ncbi:Epoxyqueuosine reductase [subsurface metagenome]
MTSVRKKEMSSAIIKKAQDLGASLAGIANVEELKKAPSFVLAPKLPQGESVANRLGDPGLKPGEVAWPEEGKSALIIAVEHPEDKPELDWWENRKTTPGNSMLIKIIDRMSEWVEENYKVKTYHILYHVEKGGIFLKDSAVLAGLGTIGKNNILVTPEYGPRVRLRAMILTEDLPSTGPIAFDPCKDCDIICKKACPGNAMDKKIYSEEKMGQKILPGTDGSFSRDICNIQMEKDLENAEEVKIEGQGEPIIYVKYCRACEISCHVGKK